MAGNVEGSSREAIMESLGKGWAAARELMKKGLIKLGIINEATPQQKLADLAKEFFPKGGFTENLLLPQDQDRLYAAVAETLPSHRRDDASEVGKAVDRYLLSLRNPNAALSPSMSDRFGTALES
ncbi:MAG: hypothetical protein WC304_03070 [Candidatus Gracilibacteria bacterium]|jgi:hypothetical protein